jgi:hypothetical protein
VSRHRRKPLPPFITVFHDYDEFKSSELYRKYRGELRSKSDWWFKHSRKIIKGQEPVAAVDYDRRTLSWSECVTHGTEGTVTTSWTPRVVKVWDRYPVFSLEQTVIVKKQVWTKAEEFLWDVFGQHTNKDYRVPKHLGDWRTFKLKVSREELKNHFYRIESEHHEFALRAGPETRFVGIDTDLHGDDPGIFSRQIEILLRRFYGRQNWHLAVADNELNGVHLLYCFPSPVPTKEAVDSLRAELVKLDAEHPELARQAIAAGMKTFSTMEIKPTESVALRLPLCKGRNVLLDGQPLGVVTRKGKQYPDIVTYAKWLKAGWEKDQGWLEASQNHDGVQAALEYVIRRIKSPQQKKGEEKHLLLTPPQSQKERIEGPKSQSDKAFGSFQGRTAQILNDFIEGRNNPNRSLNPFIRVLALFAPFKFRTSEEAEVRIKEMILGLPTWEMSARLTNNKWPKIEKEVYEAVSKAFNGWTGQSDPQASEIKLRASWAAWERRGFDPFEIGTYQESRRTLRLGRDFEWQDEHLPAIEQIKCLLITDSETAAKATKHILRLIDHNTECAVSLVKTVLESYGIKCGSKKYNKPGKLLSMLRDLGWLVMTAEEAYDRRGWDGPKQAKARSYRVGEMILPVEEFVVPDSISENEWQEYEREYERIKDGGRRRYESVGCEA